MAVVSLYFISFSTGLLGAWLVIKYGALMGVNDVPNNRSSHLKTIPKGGGAGILAALIITSLTLSVPLSFWLPALIIALISFWGGDIERLSPGKRLLAQFGCSVVFLVYLKTMGMVSLLLCFPLAFFIVGTANFYNFMDGIDGIAGITGVVGFSLLAVYSYQAGVNAPYGILCISIGFACLGFLCFNFPRAKVFLGDIGSVLLGFVFACLIIVLSKSVREFVVMVGFLAPFYLDEFFTMALRIRNGDSLIKPHRKHVYQMLANELSISHWKISISYGVIQLIMGLALIFVDSKGVLYLMLFYLLYGFSFILVSVKIYEKAAVK